MTATIREAERIDDLQRKGYRIIQNPAYFCFGMDAVLLSAFASVPENGSAIDLGCGNGVIPLLLAARTGAKTITGLEIQSECADMARRSVALNHLKERINIIEGDIRKAGELFSPASFDTVTCNPPYMKSGHGLINGAKAKLIARHEILCSFEDVARAASRLLKVGGKFYLVHRPFRLPEILTTLKDFHLEPKRMRLVYPYVDQEPNMVLIESALGGNAGMRVEKPLIIYDAPGQYAGEVFDIYNKE